MAPERSVATGEAAPVSQPPATQPAPAAIPPAPVEAPTRTLGPRGSGRRVVFAFAAVALLAVGALAATLLAGRDTADDGGQSSASVASTKPVSGSQPPQERTVTVTQPGGVRTSTETAPAPPPAVAAFSTPRSSGAPYRAAYCKDQSGVLYCWTPNDGYTIAMGDGAPYRVRDDENLNKAKAPAQAPLLKYGQSQTVGAFVCESEPATLTCRNENGYSWRMPRYKGFPQAYGPDGESLGKVEN